MNNFRQKASAIIVAIAIVSLVSIISVGLMIRNQQQISLTNAVKVSVQSEQYQKELLKEVIRKLQDDVVNNKDKAILDNLPININLEHLKRGYQANAYIIDAQAYFNINNLSDTTWSKSFTQLQQLINPSLSKEDAEAVTEKIASMINTQDSIIRQYFLLPSQLLQKKIISESEFYLLEPLIVALPNNTPVNINSVNPIVLASLGDGMTLDDAKKIITPHKTYQSIQSFLQNEAVQSANISQDQLTVNSCYFMVKGLISYHKQRRIFTALLYRPSADTNAQGLIVVDVLWVQGG